MVKRGVGMGNKPMIFLLKGSALKLSQPPLCLLPNIETAEGALSISCLLPIVMQSLPGRFAPKSREIYSTG
jgi:hypothetical protein